MENSEDVRLRDEFAKEALRIRGLTGLLPMGASPEQIAWFVYCVADQMLVARRKIMGDRNESN